VTSRERVRTALAHRQPDRVPIGMNFQSEVFEKVKKHLGLDDRGVWEWIGQDFSGTGAKLPGVASDVRYADPTVRVDGNGRLFDIWGVPFRQVKTEFQSYVELAGEPPLAGCESIEELTRYPWPRADAWDYSAIHRELEAVSEMALTGHSRGFFEIAHFMRGMEGFLTDLALNPEFAGALMDHISEFLLEKTRRTLEAGGGQYMIFEYNDDVASQRGLFISPGMWREHIKPRMAEFCKVIHAHGAKVRYHCCGSPYAILNDLVEIGVDILHPVQPLATDMDPFRLKEEFGDRLTFHGAIDTQRLLPMGSETEVRRHVRKMIDVVGRNGGYILAGSHSIQGDVPLGNILAMVEEAKRSQAA
jgi:uroporphyrinogen decarboxylase